MGVLDWVRDGRVGWSERWEVGWSERWEGWNECEMGGLH